MPVLAHGWRGANMVFWNVTAPSLEIQNPITAQNWLIGGVGDIPLNGSSNTRDSGNFDSRNKRNRSTNRPPLSPRVLPPRIGPLLEPGLGEHGEEFLA